MKNPLYKALIGNPEKIVVHPLKRNIWTPADPGGTLVYGGCQAEPGPPGGPGSAGTKRSSI
jgi:hypothetical protein